VTAVLRAAHPNRDDCQWQSFRNLITGVAIP